MSDENRINRLERAMVACAALIDAAFEMAQVNSPTLMDLRESLREELDSIANDLAIDALPGDRNDE